MEDYQRGTVGVFNSSYGHGYILLDEPIDNIRTLLINWKSLQRPDLKISKGDRVSFYVSLIDGELKAEDVQLLPDEYEVNYSGRIKAYKPDRGYGFIEVEEHEDVFFHVKDWVDPTEPVLRDSLVSFNLIHNSKGWHAINIEVIKPKDNADNYLSRAIIARDKREFEEALRIYELGLENSPSYQLVLSYAAVLKNLHRNELAKKVLLRGISLFPNKAKLREDLGSLLISMQKYDESISHLEMALKLTRESNKDGGGFILTLLGKAHFYNNSFSKSISCYEEAQNLFIESKMPNSDIKLLEFARVRSQHYNGNAVYSFLNSDKFEILSAKLFPKITEGAEFSILFKDENMFRESYGLNKQILIRVYFKNNINDSDLKDFDGSIKEKSMAGYIDDQVAVVVVPALIPEFEKLLWRRVEDKKGLLPTVVPLTISEIETENASQSLQLAFDRWLYRRDLYAGNRPVVGRKFYGRGKPLSEIRESVNNGACSGIFGLRKVGKTSILKESQRRLVEAGSIAIYIDLLRVPSDLSNCNWIYWKIGDELYKAASKLLAGIDEITNIAWRLCGVFVDYLDVPDGYPVSSALDSDITQLLTVLEKMEISPRPKIIIFFDEIERLIPSETGNGLLGSFELLSYLRGVNQENENFIVVIAGANAKITEDAHFFKKDNPVFNFFQEIYLPLLEKTECDAMVKELGKGMGINYEVAALDHIFSLSGGHPFITRQLCSFIADQFSNRPIIINKKQIESTIDFYLDIKSGDFTEILQRLERDFPDELNALLVVSNYNTKGLLSVNKLRELIGSTSIKHLIGYQLIKIENDSVVLTMGLLVKWLLKEGIANK